MTKKPIVAHKRTLLALSKDDILEAVKNVMELANWQDHVSGNRIFIKPNLLSDQLIPGQCTSPWVLEGVVKTLKEHNPGLKILIGDTDVATSRQVERAASVWGVRHLCSKYNIPFVNLSKDKTVPVYVGGKIFDKINIPKSIHESDSMLTVPVAKTHNVTVMTAALKNQWGCIPRFRHQYHPVTDWAIPEINKAVSPDFVVVDATVSMEDAGPRIGIPKVTNSLFASHDIVAMDTCIARFMGIDPQRVDYILNAQAIDLGKMNYTVIGDPVQNHIFKPAILKSTPIVYMEMQFRKVPGLKWLLFDTPLFHLFAFIAARYNTHWWYYAKGRRHARELIRNNPLYKLEFEELMKKARVIDNCVGYIALT